MAMPHDGHATYIAWHERLARVETGAREGLELGTSGNTTKMAMPRDGHATYSAWHERLARESTGLRETAGKTKGSEADSLASLEI
jgi:hypothetical protein